jgi:hypothetical protein
VWLGAFDAQGEVTISTQARLLGTPAATGPHDPPPSHVTTMTVGYVLFQAFSIDYVLADAHSLPQFDANPPQPFDQALPRIWPVARPIAHWPPDPYVDRASLGRVVLWA